MMQYSGKIGRRQADAADAKRLNGNGAISAVSERGFGGGSATNKPFSDEHFCKKCSH
jgi:hypothetical protein